MALFISGINNDEDYNYEDLRRDLVDTFGAQSAVFSGGFGFLEMCDAEDASNEQLLEMAIKEGFDIDKYRK